MRLANLAIQTPDLAELARVADGTPGLAVTARHELETGPFLELRVGDVVVNAFDRLLYADAGGQASGASSFAHISFFVDDLDHELADPAWAGTLVWGPSEISGGFGVRRIAFFEPLPGLVIELMQDLT
jgi:hypothetical protein